MGLLGLGALVAVLRRPAPAPRVVFLCESLAGTDRETTPGLEGLVTDLLEVGAAATVTQVPAEPSRADLAHLPPATTLLRLRGQRVGGQLGLSCEWTTAGQRLQERPWVRQAIEPQAPIEALRQLAREWPLPLRHGDLARLVPNQPTSFWRLLEGLAIREDSAAVAHLAAAQQLVNDEPDCATAWVVLGDHLYRSLWVNPDLAGIGLNSRTHRAFKQAVELVPGHPRATFLWSMMLTDTGNQGLALQALRGAIHQRPGIPDLYLGVAYAGRTSGLLEVARNALQRREALLAPLHAPSAWFAETTYLYLGDLEGFRRDLARAASAQPDPVIQFYRGYFELLQGHNDAALQCMRAGSHIGPDHAPFQVLCRVYTALLEGRVAEGLALLQAVDQIRGRLRIPDGEWTFKEAEAYALLGNADRGVDCATRAFVQGFSCAAWYERSPFLGKVRQHPRWPMLLRNVKERQAVLQGTFPPSAF